MFANLGGNSDRREILDNSTYDRIRGRATALLRREMRDHRLDPADLVHEAFLRIAKSEVQLHLQDGAHLVALLTIAMRRTLIDHGRAAGSQTFIPLDPEMSLGGDSAAEALTIRDLLRRLQAHDERLYWVVVMRFFWGLDLEEVASALRVSSRTVKRDWHLARFWMRKQLGGQWLGRRDSNPDTQIQSLQSYR